MKCNQLTLEMQHLPIKCPPPLDQRFHIRNILPKTDTSVSKAFPIMQYDLSYVHCVIKDRNVRKCIP